MMPKARSYNTFRDIFSRLFIRTNLSGRAMAGCSRTFQLSIFVSSSLWLKSPTANFNQAYLAYLLVTGVISRIKAAQN